MNKILVPLVNNNETEATLVSWDVEDKSEVKKGDIIGSIETTKADIEIESEFDGKIKFVGELGKNYKIGDVIAIIYNSESELKSFESMNDKKEKKTVITKPAREFMSKNNISEKAVLSLGLDIIKTKDIKHLINENININQELIIKNNNKKPLVIIGAGGGAKMLIDSLETNSYYQVVGLLDDTIKIGEIILGIPVIGKTNCINKLQEIEINNFIIAFGVLVKRKERFKLYKSLKLKGCVFPNIIHPHAIVEKSVELGEGNVILAGANVGSSVKLGNLNYINNSSIVSHDCILTDNIHISPGAVLGSSVKIEDHVLVGMNTTLYLGISIGESTTILNGLRINSDIDKNIIQREDN